MSKPRPVRTGTFRMRDETVAIGVLAVGLLALWLMQPGFFRPRNLVSELRTLLPLFCIALGQMIVISARGIDLSIGPLVTLSSVVMISLFGETPGGPSDIVAISAGILVAVAGGGINGALVSVLKLQPVIATFASSFVWSGLALWVLPQPGGVVPQWLSQAIRWWQVVPAPVIVIAVLAGVWWAFLQSGAYRRLIATGGKPDAAQTTGIDVARVQFWTYVAAGGCAGLAALLLCSDISSGDPLVGNALTLPSIVAVVVGGTRLTGGNATFAGTLAGVLVLVVLRSLVFAAGLPFQWQPLIDGSLLVVALSLASVLARWGAKP